jgi:hypothetical protein
MAKESKSKKWLSWMAILLLSQLIFQLSVLPDTLYLRLVSRVINAGTLVVLAIFAFDAIAKNRIRKASPWVVVPSALVFVGYLINVSRSLSPETLGYVSVLTPWLAVLSVPFMKSFNLERCWSLFYRFMLLTSVVSLVEYGAVFFGLLRTTPVETSYGDFEKGIFTIFFVTNGDLYHRLYGIFPEPGSFAMLLLPAVAYALVYSKRWATGIFLGCIFLTGSLGGYASLVVLVTTYLYWRSGKMSVQLISAAGFALTVMYFFGDFFSKTYESRGMSRITRVDNVFNFYDQFWEVMVQSPFGVPLVGTSLTALHDTNAMYLGSDFGPYTAFVLGGFLALIGYSTVFLASAFMVVKYFTGKYPDKTMACVFISLPALQLFVFQRQTIFDMALFAFLFASPIMIGLKNYSFEPATGRSATQQLSPVRVG